MHYSLKIHFYYVIQYFLETITKVPPVATRIFSKVEVLKPLPWIFFQGRGPQASTLDFFLGRAVFTLCCHSESVVVLSTEFYVSGYSRIQWSKLM